MRRAPVAVERVTEQSKQKHSAGGRKQRKFEMAGRLCSRRARWKREPACRKKIVYNYPECHGCEYYRGHIHVCGSFAEVFSQQNHRCEISGGPGHEEYESDSRCQSLEHKRHGDGDRTCGADIHRYRNYDHDRHGEKRVRAERQKQCVRNGNGNYSRYNKTYHKPFAYRGYHIHKPVAHRFHHFPYKCCGNSIVIGKMYVCLCIVTCARPVYRHASEYRSYKGCDGPEDGERQSEQSICGGDGVNSGLRCGDEE